MLRKVVITFCGFGLLCLIGCAAKVSMPAPTNSKSEVPKWELNPENYVKKGFIMGSGSFDMQNGKIEFGDARNQADFNARVEIGKVLSGRVASVLEKSFQSAGVVNVAQTKVSSEVATSATGVVKIDGAQIVEREILNGKVFSLAQYPITEETKVAITDAVIANITNSMTNSDAAQSKVEHEKLMKDVREQLKVSLSQ